MGARCLYEVLGVERGCAADELKRAYRRAALEWHPDKNAHRREEAEERFKEVGNAWEVLSDPGERAWYDRHREQILRAGERHQAGGDAGAGGAGGGRPDSEPDLFPLFSRACYRGFGAGPGGFYAVYAEAFAGLADLEGRGAAAPRFGGPGSPWAEVSRFYSWWGSFASERDFSWADVWNPSGGSSRKARRMMEDENRKACRKARAEFNEQVRSLASFVQRRDPRVKRHREEEAERRERAAAEAKAREAEEREARRRRVAAYEAERFGDLPDDGDAAAEMEALEREREEEREELWCHACDKRFKSAGQLRNHLGSRKHLDMVARLRAALEADEAGAADGLDPLFAPPPDAAPAEGTPQAAEPRGRSSKKGKKKAARERRAQAEKEKKEEAVATAAAAAVAAAAAAAAAGPAGAGGEGEDLAAQLGSGLNLAGTGPGKGASGDEDWGDKRAKKKKGRRAAKGEKATAAGGGASPQVEETHACSICGARYPSRSKLFKHIRESGHAALKSA